MPVSVGRETRAVTRKAVDRLSVAMVSVHGDPLLPLGAEEAGGQNVYVREVARALGRRGHRVDVFTRGREVSRPEILELDDARVVRLPCGPAGFLSRNVLHAHLGEFVVTADSLARHHDAQYDVLHSNYWLSGWVGMRLSERWGVAQVHTHHSLGAVKFAATGELPPDGRKRLEVEGLLSERCAAIVATSPEDAASIVRYYPRPVNTTIVPCGVDAAIFRPGDAAAARQDLGLPLDTAVLAYAGRFDPNKGIDTFVEAAARIAPHRSIRLLFAGGFDPAASDSDEFRRIERLVVERGLADRTTFLGRLTSEQLAPVFRAADVVVVPSHYESFGLVSIEAMACGTPVVASDVGGLRFTVVHRETGLLAPPRDAGAFASAIARLLDDDELRARMGRAAARMVGRIYTWDAVAERLETLYAGVARDGRARGA